MTLFEVLIAVGVSGLALMSVMSMLQVMNLNSGKVGLMMSRGQVLNQVRSLVLDAQNLDYSAKLTKKLGVKGYVAGGSTLNHTQFEMLENCIPGSATDECDKTTFDVPGKGIRFYLTNRPLSDPVNNETILAGENVYYNPSGIRCTVDSEISDPKKCPIYADVFFEPFCLNFATTCYKPNSITVRYEVGIRSGGTSSGALKPLAGETYVPLQKGVVITSLFSESLTGLNNHPSSGVYLIEKNILTPGQMNIKGLRFQVKIGDSANLDKMRLQYRRVTGPTVAGLSENTIPTRLQNSTWSDLRHPETNAPTWSISLVGAQTNQNFMFGTSTHFFRTSARYINDPFYMWTLASNNVPRPPDFKTGFYQFRVMVTDVNNAEFPSSNMATVRIFGRPQILSMGAGPQGGLERNCTENSNLGFSYYVVDDESVVSDELSLNGISKVSNTPNFTSDLLNYTFDRSSPASNYTITVRGENYFSNKVLQQNNSGLQVTMEPTVLRVGVNLIESPVNFSFTQYPSQIRLNTSGSVTATYSTGNCCTNSPSLSWSYPASPSQLSGASSSNFTCSLLGSRRVCSSVNSVLGGSDGPSFGANNLNTNLGNLSSNRACVPISGNQTGRYIPVVNIPAISFFLSESLWLDIPSNSGPIVNRSKPAPVAELKISFQPLNTVRVNVLNASNGAVLCSDIEFTGCGGDPALCSNAVRYARCTLPANYTGKIVLAPGTGGNVQGVGVAPSTSFDASLDASSIQHTVCNANLTNSLLYPARKNFSMTHDMQDTPWSYQTVSGLRVQYPENDFGHWNGPGAYSKTLRCYNKWNLFNDVYNFQDGGSFLEKYHRQVRRNVVFHKSSTIKYEPFYFSRNLDWSAPQVPEIFFVTKGNSSSAVWSFTNEQSETSTTSPEAFSDITNSVCSGDSALQNIKLLKVKMKGFDNQQGTMKVTDGVNISIPGGWYYGFMCSYGRYNPSGRSYAAPAN